MVTQATEKDVGDSKNVKRYYSQNKQKIIHEYKK
jgi:hypothetical protein